ncbi:uncharacterized protein LOC106061499 [Biomphalaria glabrata]|uniref:Uncharacterized protein LOC106061499 n=1 Tax=Biomphalaria glabrata TaxID=6526 RepID=A0A9U8E6T4_BIOGL|nr:uncharacterized protein LOC106061499 [Biomphalaria glabrata]XP_055878385.1 uncharacterized protein LOC106061499 [Biomphalaria glabrata]XP_055878386.1 uncharacterized protein LOC106061499 [Biomphalaria glabrata]
MVVATVTVVAGVAAIAATGGAAAPIVAAAAEGVALGATGAATATAAGVAGATAAATSAGAVTGAVAAGAAGATATGVVTGAATSAAIAGGTAVGVSASGTGAAGLVTAGVAAGPVGWLILGTEKHIVHKSDNQVATYTFDCWKQVVHDMSTEPSKGKLLRDVAGDPRVKQTIVKSNGDGQLPEIILQNIWDELFSIDFVMLSSQQLAAHAVRM